MAHGRQAPNKHPTTARIPWWVLLLCAPLSYGVLTAAPAIAPSATIPMLHTLSFTLPPAIVLFVFSAAYYQLLNRRRALEARWQHRIARYTGMTTAEFSQRLGDAFRHRGYGVQPTGTDGGINFILHRDDEKFLVDCRELHSKRVGLPAVRALRHAIHTDAAGGGFLITGGTVNDAALRFANEARIDLIDGRGLLALMRAEAEAKAERVETASLVPACPECGAPMVQHLRRPESSHGRPFWGCRNYPDCRGELPIVRNEAMLPLRDQPASLEPMTSSIPAERDWR